MRALSIIMLVMFASLAHSSSLVRRLNSHVAYSIDGTNPLTAIIFPGSIGTNASPRPNISEVEEALAQFQDVDQAISQIEQLKQKHQITRGSLYIGFTYNSDTGNHLRMTCGVSRRNNGDYDDASDYRYSVETGVGPNSGHTDFKMFKLSSREERVREISRCLASMEGMPPLRPTPTPTIRRVYMDNLTKQEGRNWMRRHMTPQEIADPSQLYRAFKCMVEKAARNMPNATGDNLVLRAFVGEEKISSTKKVITGTAGPMTFSTEVPYQYRAQANSALLAVVGTTNAVNEIYSRDMDDGFHGLWPISYGNQGRYLVDSNGNPADKFTVIFNQLNGMGNLSFCKLHAGIVPVPTRQMMNQPHQSCQ